MAKKPLLQIKDIMAAVDRKDYGFYERLTDEQRKSMNLWMTQRYASSVQGKLAGHYLVMINEFMNCLLYTSPSPRDGLLSRMPSSA